MNIKILKYKENLIDEITNIIAKSKEIENNLIVFPGKRPSYFLLKKIHNITNKAFIKPDIFSIDDFITHLFNIIKPETNDIKTIDAIALIFNLFKEHSSLFNDLTLDTFISWGSKLYPDFEELKLNNISYDILKYFDNTILQELPENITNHIRTFSEIYKEFYNYIEQNSLSTRAYKYNSIANNIDILLDYLQPYEHVIFAGFFGLSKTEITIFKKIGESLTNSLFIFQEGPGISNFLKHFDFKYKEPALLIHNQIKLYKATENHKQIFFLNSHLDEELKNINTCIVLPDSSMLFPILFNTTPLLNNQFNISMGYPIYKTPIFSLISLLEQLIINKIDDRIFINDYLQFIMHPYIKNITYQNNSTIVRIIVHTIFDFYKKNNTKLINLNEVLTKELLQNITQQLSNYNITQTEIITIIDQIHNICIKPFFNIENINDFTQKLHKFILFIFEKSTAWQHPYSQNVIETIDTTIREIYLSKIKEENFQSIEKYFKLIESIFNNATFKLPGTPLEGLQILGFLETRNLQFENLYILNANETILPNIKKHNTILNNFIRDKLGLPTSKDTENLIKYYFFTLINNSNHAHLFYIENSENEKSRFIEQIIWELQKQKQTLQINIIQEIEYPVNFAIKKTESKKKNKAIIDRLVNLSFSATSIDTYLSCPLKFYYKYILNIKEDYSLQNNDDKIQQSEIGFIVHEILNKLFSKKQNVTFNVSKHDYEIAEQIIKEKFIEKFKFIEGEIYLIYFQVKNRIFAILNYYKKHMENRKILHLEKELNRQIEIKGHKIKLKGFVDRIDIESNKIIILDYKTSFNISKIEVPYIIDNFEDFKDQAKTIQLPFYIMLSRYNNLINSNNNDFDGRYVLLNKKEIEERSIFKNKNYDIKEKFQLQNQAENFIISLINEILDPNTTFSPTKNYKQECPHCEFKILCDKQWIFPHKF